MSTQEGIVSDRSQVQMIGAAPLKTWQEYREGALSTYGGGYRSDDDLKAFHHGIETIFNLLEAEFPKAAFCKAAPAMAALLRTELESLDRWLQDQSCSDETLGEMLVREDEIQKLLKDLEG